jgi:hypothetical protein
MKFLLMRGVKSPKCEKSKTLQDFSTKALMTAVGQSEEKFMRGMHPLWFLGCLSGFLAFLVDTSILDRRGKARWENIKIK